MKDPLEISHDVSSALNRNHPVVALESSLIAHGLPSPVNVETALAMEEAVRAGGAEPATIGVIEGQVKVGLSADDIKRLGKGDSAKLAARDVLYAAARKLDGGTTVSATARIAAASGIGIMATGGIGGVHRLWSETGDISADLWELARTPIVVVCSGAKAVLDIPATMEWLETHGVAVYGYQTDEFPAFYSRSSGIGIPKIESAEEFAEMARTTGGAFGMRSAVVIAVPVPKEAEVDVAAEIEQADAEAAVKGISGKDLTPYLLSRVSELTKGKSQKANIALLRNNASVAAQIAIALQESANRRMGF